MSLPIDISTPQVEGILQVSKSRKLPILIDLDEMQSLFEALGKFQIFDVSRPVKEGEMEIGKDVFLKAYKRYVEGIKQGKLIDEIELKPFFSAAISIDPKAFYAMKVAGEKYLVKPRKPVLQCKRHHFIYSEAFHSGVMGAESVTWGLEISYPQLCLDPKAQTITKIAKGPEFPNTELFSKLSKWVRDHTRATPFIVGGKKLNQPMRIGKKAILWINNHPGLKDKGIYVEHPEHTQISHPK